MQARDDPEFMEELEVLRIVVHTIGENAVTQDEMDVAEVLACLLVRLERAEVTVN